MAHDGQDVTMATTSVILPDLLTLTGAAIGPVEAVLETAKAAVRETVTDGDRVSAKLIEANQAAAHGLSWLATYVEALRQMDARRLDFPDNHFDTVAAMHVLSVVPEPEKVMAEIARVCRPGGSVVITNHFVREHGVLASLERLFAPFANTIGWHSDFEIRTVLQEEALTLSKQKALPPLGMMTLLVLKKTADDRHSF